MASDENKLCDSDIKTFFIILFVLFLLPFIIRPNNISALSDPFKSEQYLLVTAIMPEPDEKEFLELAWPDWFIQFVVSKYRIDFASNLDGNQSKLEFILAGVFWHEEKEASEDEINYVLSLA